MAKKAWSERSRGGKFTIVTGWLVVALMGLAIFAPDPEDAGGNVAAAEPLSCAHQDVSWRAPMRAEAYVKERLVSPRSAKFGDHTAYLMPSDDEGVCIYTVTGTVDADNRLGVSIRHHYAAKVRFDMATEDWSEIEVAISE
ncbi:hypothetical protein [Paracoccus sp. (in: a-proteobacteria)]|uniref:hypothetical protein n=1 Tax=Paracoccus sp. TaxID=267 RepID=UPI00272D0681|nr:hypothetical protein [Paracoccus sp. (in: a-proteobacteria)]